MRTTSQAILAFFLLGLGACASLGERDVLPPEVFLADVAPVGGGLFEQRVRITFRVTNPNAFDLDVAGLSFELDMNGEPLARGVSNEPVVLAGLSEQLVSAEASTTTFSLLHQLLRLGERRELAYDLRGKLHLADGVARSLAFQRAARLGPSFAPDSTTP